MAIQPNAVYRKTEQGRAELAQRSHGLALATRAVLIMVNGALPATALSAGGLDQAAPHLQHLSELGLIEPVALEPLRPAPQASQSIPPTPAPSPAAPPEAPAPAAVTDALKRRAFVRLQEHFGLDTPTVAQALLQARDAAAFNAALSTIESKLAIYMGKRMAARTVEDLRAG